MVFQDPYESMNPRRTIFDTVAEPLKVQKIGGPFERMESVSRILGLVGLTPPRPSCSGFLTSCRAASVSASR